MAIVDQTGKPIKQQELTEPQTARVAQLYQEFALHPVRGLTPGKLASILEAAEQGDMIAQCDLFDDMEEKDGHIFAEMSKRKRALLGLDWDIVPPRNATKQEENAAALVKELLLDLSNFEDIILDMADAIGKAYACLEMEWHRLGSAWLPETVTHRPQRWFMVDRETRSELRLRNNGAEGEPLRPMGWITHVHRARSGYLARSGLHRVLAWPFLFKNYSVRDLAEFLEIYGLPLRLGTYPSGASDEEKSTLLRAVVNIGHAAAGIVPEGMMIDFKESAKGNKDPFQAMIEWCESTQSKAILGGTLTSTAANTGLGSNLGDVHNEVRHDLLEGDALQIAGTLTRDLIYPLVALNTTGIDGLRRCPRLVFDTQEPEDLALYSEALPKLVGVGMRIPEKWAHEKLRIPEPEEDEAVLQTGSSTSAIPPPEALRTAIAALRTHPDAKDTPDRQVERLEQEGATALENLIDPVRRLVDQAESLEEIRDGILTLYKGQDIAALSSTLQQALAAAELAGRFEAQEK